MNQHTNFYHNHIVRKCTKGGGGNWGVDYSCVGYRCRKIANLRNDAPKSIYIPTKFYLDLTMGMCPYPDEKVRQEGSRI